MYAKIFCSANNMTPIARTQGKKTLRAMHAVMRQCISLNGAERPSLDPATESRNFAIPKGSARSLLIATNRIYSLQIITRQIQAPHTDAKSFPLEAHSISEYA